MEGVHFERVATNGVTLNVAVAGPEDGPMVVLLHGFPEFWYCWRHQIPALVEAGYRVIAPNLRGYEHSDKPRGVKHYGIDDLADDVAGLLNHYGADKAPIIGHDWGGAITWHFGHRHPDRASRLAVLNCPHPDTIREALFKDSAQRKRSWYIFMFQLPFIPERYIAKNNYASAWAAMAKKASNRGVFTDADRAVYTEAWSQPYALTAMLNYYRASIRVPPAPRRAETIPAPLLLIWGTADHALGESMIDPSLAHAEDARVKRLDGISHWVNVDAAEDVNAALLSWLSGQDPS
ncbi:MAG: alpha/beta hydrolase [Proteobacteria bacterium]|nr:alpha/beta hydrolase [Pseudomonadota bacterium]